MKIYPQSLPVSIFQKQITVRINDTDMTFSSSGSSTKLQLVLLQKLEILEYWVADEIYSKLD